MQLTSWVQVTRLLVALCFLDTASALPKGPPSWGGKECPDNAQMAYFMNNEVQNCVIALQIGGDGLVSSIASVTPTGGAGGSSIDPMTGALNGPDALGSQGSVQISGDLLFVVNPGSSTLSLFQIADHDPSVLTLIGQPVATGGDFPVSVAVSSKLQLACVGNTGARSGVSCTHYDAKTGLGSFDGLRSIPLGQTTPPAGPADGIAQVLFSEGDSDLVTLVKGNGTAADPGSVRVYSVDPASGQVAASGTSTVVPGGYFLFGTTVIPGTSNLLVSDAGYGYLILNLNDLNVPVASTNITNGAAPCWAITSSVTGTGFIDDVIVSQLVEADLTTGAIVSVAPNNNNGQGLIDMRAVGDKIYALSPGNGTVPAALTVFDISGGRGSQKSVQNFIVDAAGRSSEGLAVYGGGDKGY